MQIIDGSLALIHVLRTRWQQMTQMHTSKNDTGAGDHGHSLLGRVGRNVVLGAALISTLGATVLPSGPAAAQSQPIVTVAQAQTASQLPPIFSQTEDGFTYQVETPTALQTSLAKTAMGWARALNAYDVQGMKPHMSYPFYINGTIVASDANFQTQFRQWFIEHRIEGYQPKDWAIDRLDIYPNKTWENSVSGQYDKPVLNKLGSENDGFTTIVVLKDKEGSEQHQIFHMTARGGRPAIVGIWDYKPPPPQPGPYTEPPIQQQPRLVR